MLLSPSGNHDEPLVDDSAPAKLIVGVCVDKGDLPGVLVRPGLLPADDSSVGVLDAALAIVCQDVIQVVASDQILNIEFVASFCSAANAAMASLLNSKTKGKMEHTVYVTALIQVNCKFNPGIHLDATTNMILPVRDKGLMLESIMNI